MVPYTYSTLYESIVYTTGRGELQPNDIVDAGMTVKRRNAPA
jgi:hypothetical protein